MHFLFVSAANAFAVATNLGRERSIQYDIKEGQLMGTSLYSNGEIFLVSLARHDFKPSYIVDTLISYHTYVHRSVVRAQR